MARVWVSGNTKAGHSVVAVSRKKDPWVSQVWLNGKIIRTDLHPTKEKAVDYARHRAKRFGVKLRK